MTGPAIPILREELTLGIDLGIGSCGWALIENADDNGRVVAMGVRMFDVPETAKERTPTNQVRRQKRLMRRVLKRRRQRMNDIRALFKSHGLLADAGKKALAIAGMDPWRLRAEALERPLDGKELAVALGHVAKHRGFKSNSKRDRGRNASEESSKMLGAISALKERLGKYRTVGEMFAKDEEFAVRKRNREGDYSRSVLRDDQENEIRLIFDRQRSMGNAIASPELEREFVDIAFFQRPLQDSEDRVGWCPFEPEERRAAKHSPAFELFRLASRLASLRIRQSGNERALTEDEISTALKDFGAPGVRLTYWRLRKLLDLDDRATFDVPLADEKRREIATRSSDQAAGTKALRNVLGAAWEGLMIASPEKMDRAAAVIAFRESTDSIRKGLEDIGFDSVILETLMKGVGEGEFAHFKGAGHISARAARNILPHLMRGLVYSDACKAAGYDHAKRPQTDLSSLANPVARKALGEALKQVRAIVREHGLPGAMHVELAREVGKSTEERDKITRGIEDRNKAKDRLREEFRATVGRDCAGAEDLLRFELWKEQKGRCVYTDKMIEPGWLVSSDNRVQVDHILPWSRSGDDSFVNKTLCMATANQDKRGLTPFEWFGKDERRWASYVRAVEDNPSFKGRKKRNYLLRDARVLEEKFRPRNLTDTQYAARLLADLLKGMYPDDGRRRVFTRPGPLTDRLRRAWGIQGLKKDAEGRRIPDDRHHALDALIVAATTEGALNRLTRAAKSEEERGSSRFISSFPPPWPRFKDEAHEKLGQILVSRPERGRVRGEAHEATIRSIIQCGAEQLVFERKPIEKIAEADLARIKDAQRNVRIVESLRAWISAGKPKNAPPLSPKGDPIRKVSIQSSNKVGLLVRGGAAGRGEMVRVDVFRRKNNRGVYQFFLVPIYPHQVANLAEWPTPPGCYIQSGGAEAPIQPAHEFIFSIYPMSFIRVVKEDGEIIEGYFRGVDRNTNSLAISEHHTSEQKQVRKGIGARTLADFRKLSVDRFGRRHEIERETRTWHGVACI